MEDKRIEQQGKSRKAVVAFLKKSFGSRAFRVGGYSVFAFVLVFGIIIAINVLIRALPREKTEIDITETKLFNISPQTKEVCEALDEDVTVYWVVKDGQEDENLSVLLERYADLSSHIQIKKLDPDGDLAFIEPFTEGATIYNNSLIVAGKNRYRYLDYYNYIFYYDYTDYYVTGEYALSFIAERSITSALSYIVSDNLTKLYIIEGHGEAELTYNLKTQIESQNMEVQQINLLSYSEIPADADCILLNAPQTDISANDLRLLMAYLNEGGNMVLFTDLTTAGEAIPNVLKLASVYGMRRLEGIIVEGDEQHCLPVRPYYLIPDLQRHDITKPLAENNYRVLLTLAQGIELTGAEDPGVKIAGLLQTSTAAYCKQGGYGSLSTYEKESEDQAGPFLLAAIAEKSVEGDRTASLTWITSTALENEQLNEYVSGGNFDLILNVLGYVSGSEESISVHARSFQSAALTIPEGSAAALIACMLVVLPLAFLVTGIIIRYRRTRR